MRFITEFELNSPFEIKNYKGLREKGSAKWLGLDISKAFGWNKRSEIKANGQTIETHKLEIEAFPMDKWVEFKQKLFMECGMPEPNGVAILEMIKDLEFYSNNKQEVDVLIGKPSGDAITNLPDLEYRGPSSHCKACEDEKAGIKNIQAQRHTCKI